MTSSDLWAAGTARRNDTSAPMVAPQVLGPAVGFPARLPGPGLEQRTGFTSDSQGHVPVRREPA
jgi:hypothetical protein